MRNFIKALLRENLQQAEKLYFKSGKLNDEIKEGILSITHGDVFTRLVSDLVFHFTRHGLDFTRDRRMFENFYRQLTEYDKNVFPVAGNLEEYGITEDNNKHILTLAELLSSREPCIKYLRKLPSVAIRNIKLAIKTPRTNHYFFREMSDKMSELYRILKTIPDTDRTKPLLKKIFSSDNNLNQMVDVAQHYQYAFTGAVADHDKQTILDNIEYTDAEVIQDSNDVLVVRINSQKAMSTIGCTSAWCFSRPAAMEHWFDYAGLGFVYIIFDFTKSSEESTAMMTYLPDDGKVFVSTNVPLMDVGIDINDDIYLESIGVNMKKLRLNMQDTTKGQTRDYDEVDIYNEQNRKTIKNILFEAIKRPTK